MPAKPLHPSVDPHAWLTAALLLLALLAGLALYASTPYGLGLVNDTAAYLGGAENLLNGNGYTRVSGGGELKPITHFPPLFSLLLAGLGAIGLDLLTAGKLLVVTLFGVNVALTGVLTYRISGAPGFALLAALLLAASDILLEVHAYILSEPLFFTLLLLAALMLVRYYQHPQPRWLALTGLALSAAYLTRYAGVSLIASVVGVMVLLWLKRPGLYERRRVDGRGLLAFAAAVGLPLLAWSVYTFFASGELGNRSVAWRPITGGQLLEMLKNLLSWLAPDDLLLALPLAGRLLSLLSLLVAPGLVAWIALTLWRLYRRNETARISPAVAGALLFAVHVLFYLAFLVVSISLFDASTPLNARILSPAFIPLLVLVACGLAWLWQRAAGRSAWRIAIALAVALLASTALKDGWDASRYLRQDGLGFANRGWRDSQAIADIRALPDVILYSDKPAAIYLLTGRTAYAALSPIDPVTQQARENYTAELAQMQAAVRSGDALLVLFSQPEDGEPVETDAFTAMTNDLPLYADYGNIWIYGKR